jgi:phage I-like protein
MTKRKSLSNQIGIAVCTTLQSATGSLQIFPAGKFDAPHGSMLGLNGPWFIDDAIAAAAIERIQSIEGDIVIDFEHQTLKSSENGQPAPAAGWIKRDKIKWVAGKGLFADDVEWTEEAKQLINGKQYKYFSPVFAFAAATGNVKDLRLGALTNQPAIKGMDEVLAAASALFFPNQSNHEDDSMNPELLKLLGLNADATDEQAIAACKALQTENADLKTQLTEKDDAIAAASAATPDSAQAVIKELKDEVAALTARQDNNEKDELIAAAKAEGKMSATTEKWLREQTIEVVKGYVGSATPIAALTAQQTDGKNLDDNNQANLTDEQLAVCSQLGIDPKDYAAQLAQEAE